MQDSETISIADIKRSAGTQYRINTCNENIENLMSLISNGTKFHTPIRLAHWRDSLFLIDGFHRVQAYLHLGIADIPVENIEIVEAGSMTEVHLMAMKANVAHGKENTEADYCYMIRMLIDSDPDTYKKNVFEADIKAISTTIGAALRKVQNAYNNYVAPGETLTQSQQAKSKRDAAIMEMHKNGKSDNAIAKMFKMPQPTVTRIRNGLMQNPESEQCNTHDLDILSLICTTRTTDAMDNFTLLDELTELPDDWSDAPAFNICAVTGLGENQATNSNPIDYERVPNSEVSSVKLQEDYVAMVEKVAHLGKMVRDFSSSTSRLCSLHAAIGETIEEMLKIERIAAHADVKLLTD